MPDALAVLSREEAYLAINDPTSAAAVSADHDDEFVDIWLSAVSRRMDELCGPVVIRTVTDERHSGGKSLITLDDAPASAVTTVVEYAAGTATTLTAEEDSTLPANGYLIERYGADTLLRRRRSGTDARFAPGRRNVKVTYEAGRYADTASVDPLFKLAASAVLRRLWDRESSAWATSGDPFAADAGGGVRFYKTIDPMVREFLHDQMRGSVVA